MLELLNQLDGFSSYADIKVIAATNRIDILHYFILFVLYVYLFFMFFFILFYFIVIIIIIFFLILFDVLLNILDPALLRSGRLDRKIEFPLPNEEARARILQIHSRKVNKTHIQKKQNYL